MPLRLLVLLIAALCAACRIDADDFKHAMVLDKPVVPDVSAPVADTPQETRLYQLLYAGEVSDAAHDHGQRVRMLAWLRAMNLQDDAFMELLELGHRVQEEARADRDERAALAARELAVLGPVYTALEAALADPTTTAEQLQAHSQALAEAQATLASEAERHAAQRERIHSMLLGTRAWLGARTHDERLAAGTCRFVLMEHASPLTNPGAYAGLVGMVWDRGDFSALQAGEEARLNGPLDIGGLYALEHLRAPPSGYMAQSAREGLLLLALLDPAFVPAAETLARTRGLLAPPQPPPAG